VPHLVSPDFSWTSKVDFSFTQIGKYFPQDSRIGNRNARSTSTNTVLEHKKSEEAWLPQMGIEHPVAAKEVEMVLTGG
jgi:hypothetical protein